MSDYGRKLDGSLPSLAVFIATANLLVNRLVTKAAEQSVTLDDDLLAQIECWAAAHCYAMSDQPYAERKTGNSSAVFQGRTGMYWEATKYGQMAVTLDYTGLLKSMGSIKVASATWLGTPLSEQVPYVDRD